MKNLFSSTMILQRHTHSVEEVCFIIYEIHLINNPIIRTIQPLDILPDAWGDFSDYSRFLIPIQARLIHGNYGYKDGCIKIMKANV